jgi:hypothetical protein
MLNILTDRAVTPSAQLDDLGCPPQRINQAQLWL